MLGIFDPACELLPPMDEGSIKTPKPKMSPLLVFNRVYRLEIQSVTLVFSTPLVNKRPLTFSLVHLRPPPPPFPVWISTMVVFIQGVRGGGEGIGLWGEHIQYTVYLTIFEPTKSLSHPKQKPMRGGGLTPQTDKHLPPSTFTGIFFKSRHLGFGFGVFIDIWSMPPTLVS
jgi:hypothetical protein